MKPDQFKKQDQFTRTDPITNQDHSAKTDNTTNTDHITKQNHSVETDYVTSRNYLSKINYFPKKDPELEALLKQIDVPDINPDIRRSQIAKLSEDVQDMEYFPAHSFTGQILTQMSYISGWVWIAQTGILFLLYFCGFYYDDVNIKAILLFMTPGLSLILIYEISKSFSANIWEMEAACRYNLAQIFLFRLCILCGCDFLVLTCTLIVYRMTGGTFWEFCFLLLLPFFLTVSASLFFLRRVGNRLNPGVMAVVPIIAGNITSFTVGFLSSDNVIDKSLLQSATPIVTLLALFVFLYNCMRLCTEQHYLNENRKDQNLWNFD